MRKSVLKIQRLYRRTKLKAIIAQRINEKRRMQQTERKKESQQRPEPELHFLDQSDSSDEQQNRRRLLTTELMQRESIIPPFQRDSERPSQLLVTKTAQSQTIHELREENQRLLRELQASQQQNSELALRLDEARKVQRSKPKPNLSTGDDSLGELSILKQMMTENDESMSLPSGTQESEQLKEDLAKVTHERNLLKTQLSVLSDENETLQAT